MDSRDVLLGSYRNGGLQVLHEARPAGYEGPQRACHPDALELCFVGAGTEKVRLGSRARELHAGSYDLVPPGVEHSSWARGGGVRECIVHIPIAMLHQALDETGLGRSGEIPTGPFPTPPEARHIVRSLLLELDAKPWTGRSLMLESLCQSLCLWIIGRHLREPRPDSDGPTRNVRAGVYAAEEMMRCSPEESFSVDDLAKVAGMERFRFHRAFKEVFGHSPYNYLLRLRINRAAELIEKTDLSMTTIGFDLGFSSSGRFTEAFKRVYGYPPSAHRRCRRTNRKSSCTIREA